MRAATQHQFPTADIDQMLREIESAPHPHKIDAQRRLEERIASGQRLATDAEVLQESLHRYAAIGRPDGMKAGG